MIYDNFNNEFDNNKQKGLDKNRVQRRNND